MPLERGIVVGGELRDPEASPTRSRRFFGKNKPAEERGVRLGIANNRIGVRTFEIAGIDDPKQLANAIRFRAQETLPIPLEEAVLDYQRPARARRTRTASRPAACCSSSPTASSSTATSPRAARPGSSSTGSTSRRSRCCARSARRTDDGRRRGGAGRRHHVGHDRSTFAVSDGRVCEFTRVLDWGGQLLNVAIARALDLTPSEAEPIKHALSLRRRHARRGARRPPRRRRARGRARRAAVVRARARLVAALLPEPARLARDRRARAHRRHRAPAAASPRSSSG